MKVPNIFSDSVETLRILVHTESFINNPEALRYFANAGMLPNVRIYFLPLLSFDLPTNMTTAMYEHHYNGCLTHSTIICSDCRAVAAVYREKEQPEKHELDTRVEKSILAGNIACDLFHYVVVDDTVPYGDTNDVPVICLQQAREILRLFQVVKKTYYCTENESIDEMMYYIYRHKVLFVELQNLWSACLENNGIDDWIGALDHRLELITMCLDYCKIEAYKKQNNLTAMHLMYHISYLLLLVTGTFDNLAWLINNHYNLQLHKMKVDIRKSDFQKAVNSKSSALYGIITAPTFGKRIDAIREIRDRVVHRDFIELSNYSLANRDLRGSVLNLERSVGDLLLLGGFHASGIKFIIGDTYLVHTLAFIEFIESTVVDMVNRLTKTLAKEIFESNDPWVIWKMLKFSKEPYVL